MLKCQGIAVRLSNSADPDQTEEQSDLVLHMLCRKMYIHYGNSDWPEDIHCYLLGGLISSGKIQG